MFLAFDTVLHRQVALKVLDERADGETSHARLLREARNAAALIIRISARSTKSATRRCRVHCDGVRRGPSIRERLDEGGALAPDDAVRYGIQAADALAYAHDHGVIHRDFKAANAIVTGSRWLKVVDFGLARRRDMFSGERDDDGVARAIGHSGGDTVRERPNRCAAATRISRTDLWALGILL